LSLKRRFYIAYEPLIATIAVTNLAGRDLPLADDGGHQWFGFNILREDGMPVPALNPNYQLSPMTIPAGSTIKRTVNLNTLYPVHDYGPYKIRAVIYFGLMDKFFQSNPVNIEISEGKTVWQQIVGVPEGQPEAGSNRKISLLKFRRYDNNELYARVQDADTGTVYCTAALGRLLDKNEPEVVVDSSNRVHVLQIVDAKTYLHSVIGPDGAVSESQPYLCESARPFLGRDASGVVAVKNGKLFDPSAPAGLGTSSANGKSVPKISDRPVELPTD